MLFLIALAALQREGVVTKEETLDGVLGKGTILLRTPTGKIQPAKLSPKKFGEPPERWRFEWTTAGYIKHGGVASRCFEAFSQGPIESRVKPERTVRALMRLYSHNVDKLRLEHNPNFADGTVTVFLCEGGPAGGEQLFDVDPQTNTKVNTIYVYDVASLTDPVEALREIAHEYGHATLPPVGGFTEPESWSNGLLGEKLYLTYFANALRTGELTTDDTLGATAQGLEKWLTANVDPLVTEAALRGPQSTLLAGKGKPSMDALLGLALWTARLYDERVMTRALFIGGNDAKAFPDAASTAAAEPTQITLDIPAPLRGKPIWIPIGADRAKSRILGAQELTPRKGGWVRIKPGASVVVRNYRD